MSEPEAKWKGCTCDYCRADRWREAEAKKATPDPADCVAEDSEA